MIVRFNSISLFLLFSYAWCNAQPTLDDLYKDSSFTFNKELRDFSVKVLLNESVQTAQWSFESTEGIIVSDVYKPTKKKITNQKNTIVNIHNGCIYINGKKVAEKSVKLDPLREHIIHDGKPYMGSFICMVHNDSCFLINQLKLEDYVYCVLRSESWPGWPLEVNKVFAIASRTYVITKALERDKKNPYHIKNTNIHQTYNGYHSSDVLKRAVEETRGLILTHEKKPIHAMFDSCCGGIIPAHLSQVNFKKSPYLERVTPCDHCKTSKIYEWSWELNHNELEKLLQKKGFNITGIQDITTVNDKAGAVQEVSIKWGKQGSFTNLTGRQFYALSTKVKSFCYSIEKKMKKILIKGKGYGHHLGICQWGARKMIDHGWTHKGILNFYYPGTTCMKLVLK